MSSEWLTWLTLIGVLALTAGLVYAAWWALFADRARGRRRCPRCWYDLAYSPGMLCAECGFTARSESDFGRTRRRYGLAAAAILASVTVSLVVNERITQRGLPAMLPTRMLLWLIPFTGGSQSDVFAELISRGSSGRLSNAQWVDLVERCAGGDWGARPVSNAWIAKYGVVLDSWRPRLKGRELEQLLLDIEPRLDVTGRETWPEGVGAVLGVQLREWWPPGMECRIVATPHIDGAKPITFYRTADETLVRSPYSLHLPTLERSTRQIEIDFRIDRRVPRAGARSGVLPEQMEQDKEPDWQTIATRTIALPARLQGELADAAQPVEGADMTSDVAQFFDQGIVKWPTGSSPVRFQLAGPLPGRSASFNDVAIGVSVELLCDETVARRLNVWWLAGTGIQAQADRNYGFEVEFEDPKLLSQANETDGRWRLRIRGDPEIALRAGNAPKYWSGEVILPLRLQSRTGEAPPRAWTTEGE